MSIWSFLSLVLGAALATLGGVVTEVWRGHRDRRAAARVVYRELFMNYGLLIAIRIGDVEFDTQQLTRITDAAWREQTDKLALVQSYGDFDQLWAAYQVLLALKTRKPGSNASMAELDAILDMVEDAVSRVGVQAGVPRRDPAKEAPLIGRFA